MNFHRLFQFVVFAQICMFAFAYVAKADEPLSMKVEMRYGPNGPKKPAIASPGEDIDFSVSLKGLKPNEDGELTFEMWAELRSEDNELLKSIPKGGATTKSVLGSNRLSINGGVSIPEDYTAKTIKNILFIRDPNSGNEIREELIIEVRRPTSSFPLNVGYRLGNQKGNTISSGRYTTGDTVLLRFDVGEIKETKNVRIKLELFRRGEAMAVHKKEISEEIPKSRKIENKVPMFFDFRANEPFEGMVRITVLDEAGQSNSVELPLVITEALGSRETNFLAERPASEPAPIKKE
jgi:hypothetical protein